MGAEPAHSPEVRVAVEAQSRTYRTLTGRCRCECRVTAGQAQPQRVLKQTPIFESLESRGRTRIGNRSHAAEVSVGSRLGGVILWAGDALVSCPQGLVPRT
jgi:hypothetical protein